MGCGDKLKNTCGVKYNARCVYYDLVIPEWSDLHDQDCVTLEETTEDIYNTLDDIKEDLDLSDLGNNCIDYEEEEVGNIKPKEAFLALETKICEVQEALNNVDSCCIDMESIDTACLVDECGDGITTPEELLQIIINEICILKNQ